MHYAKYGKDAASKMLMHAGRGLENPDSHEHSNENIDRAKTYLNYDLKDRDGQTVQAYYKQRIDLVSAEIKERTGKSVRKDAVTLCSWVLTAPKDLPLDKLSGFFKAAYSWFAGRYGEDNIVVAAVHMDETTPHMHLQFTPIIEKDGVQRLCAKDIENRKTLQTAHKELQEYLEKELGCEVGILNGATENGNKSILQLQVESLEQQKQSLQAGIDDSSLDISVYNAKKMFLGVLGDSGEDVGKNDTSMLDIASINRILEEIDPKCSGVSVKEKGFGKNKELSSVNIPIDAWREFLLRVKAIFEENKMLGDAVREYEKTPSYTHIEKLKEKNSKLIRQINRLKDENARLSDELSNTQEELKDTKKDLGKYVKKDVQKYNRKQAEKNRDWDLSLQSER